MNTFDSTRPSSLTSPNEPRIQSTATVAAKKTGIAMVLGFILVVSWLGFIDSVSESYIDDAMKQALVSYGVARGINAVISVLQTVHLFGLGVGEVLDPLNDLVERFSGVMELAIASLVIQKVLLEITASVFFKFALTVSGGLLILSLYVRTGINNLLLTRVFISMVFIRFCIAITVMLNGIVATAFVSDKIDADVNMIEQVEKSAPLPEPTAEDVAIEAPPQVEATPAADAPPQADAPVPVTEPVKKSWFAKLKEMGSKGVAIAKDKLKKWDPKAMKEKLDKVIPNMLNVMALFLLKSLILPLVFLYGLKYALTQLWDLKSIPLYTGRPRLTPIKH